MPTPTCSLSAAVVRGNPAVRGGDRGAEPAEPAGPLGIVRGGRAARGGSIVRGGDPGVHALLETVTIPAGECAVDGEGACSSGEVLDAIFEFADEVASTSRRAKAPETVEAAVELAATALGCGTEACVISNPEFQRAVDLPASAVRRELAVRFKAAGPRDTTDLLSNFDIDRVLQQWAAQFEDFFNHPVNMMDFEATGGSLARVDPAAVLAGREAQIVAGGDTPRRPCRTAACVLNTDVSSGRGKHWVAVFVDCRPEDAGTPWTVEYFNSAGNAPPDPVTRWMEETAARLAPVRRRRGAAETRTVSSFQRGAAVVTVPVTDIRHQESRTECGLYTLYYIRRRLEGAPAADFQSERIPDEAMIGFRKLVFR